MPIRIAIVDSHTLTRYGLRELAAHHPDVEVVAECSCAADAAEVIGSARPDVVAVNASLPDGDGMELSRRLRDQHPDLGIVLLASNGEDDALFRALRSGASAFVARTAPVEEVLGAVRHAAVAPSSFTATGLVAALARRRVTHERLALSPRESQVLRLLRDGLSIPAIAGVMSISHSTVKTYAARLYEKLGAANRAQALMTALRFGLLDDEDGAPPPNAAPAP